MPDLAPADYAKVCMASISTSDPRYLAITKIKPDGLDETGVQLQIDLDVGLLAELIEAHS